MFDKLIQVLVFGCGYRRLAAHTCSATTLRRRRDEWIALGLTDQLRSASFAANRRRAGGGNGLDPPGRPVDASARRDARGGRGVAEFVPGVELGGALYREVVAPRLAGVRHSAARLGPGSDVLGYDTARSTDHDWGARLAVLVAEGEPRPLDGLPAEFRGWPVEVVVVGIGRFLTGVLGFDPRAGISTRDWLVTPQQTLASVTAGAIYSDGLGELEPVRQALAWYPRDLWLWQLAGQWRRIAQEEPFCGRAAEVGDDLGRRVLVGRLARDVMRLCFLLERRYAPYSKWLGTAFDRLDSAATVGPLLEAALTAAGWPAAEEALVAAYREVATRHNRLGLTKPLDPSPRRFHDRPWLVLDADRFVAACLATMADRDLASLPAIGAIDQFVDSTDVLGFRPSLCRQVGRVYGRAAGRSAQGLA